MKVGIIGGGLTGLSCAYFLGKKGHDITIFEKEDRLGGLADSFEVNGEKLEKFYHHFFGSDKELISILKELDMEKNISYFKSNMSFLYKNKIHAFNTPLDLLSFKPLSFIDRLKLGIMIFYFQSKKDWKNLENISIKDWVQKHFGKNIYEIVWMPLLRNKFGDEYENIPASWLWGRIHPRAQSRKKGKEMLGYLDGSFSALTDKLAEKVQRFNGKIISEKVVKIKSTDKRIILKTNKERIMGFDKVIFTGPVPEILKIAKFPEEFNEKLGKIDYQSAICTCLELKNNLSDVYWMNLSDSNLPFGGIIEHTNLVPRERYGSNLVYLFNYLPSTHKFFKMDNEELMKLYIEALKKIFPNFNEEDIIRSNTFRDKYATPIYKFGYSQIMPEKVTPIKNLLIANTAQIYPYDRNVNNSIRIGKETAELIK